MSDFQGYRDHGNFGRSGNMKSVTCPFCGEIDFDLIGLKAHFMRGWCEVFEATVRPEEERFDKSELMRRHATGRTKAGNDIGGI